MIDINKQIPALLSLVIVFWLGWMLSSVSSVDAEIPSITGNSIAEKTIERSSPQDHISENQIYVYKDRIEIQFENAQWATFTDTNSMDPVIDAGSHAIQKVPSSYEDIAIGDIISYETNKGVIIHRVIEIGADENGWYAIAKGDNNAIADPDKIRFSQVKKVLIAIIY